MAVILSAVLFQASQSIDQISQPLRQLCFDNVAGLLAKFSAYPFQDFIFGHDISTLYLGNTGQTPEVPCPELLV